jgi:hypothetical protein
VAALEWNEWQLSSGLGGSFAPEYAAIAFLSNVAGVLSFGRPKGLPD